MEESDGGLRVLFATDGSGPARGVAPLLRQIVLPVTRKLTVLTVAPQSVLSGARPDPAHLLKTSPASRKRALLESTELAEQAATELDPGVEVEAIARWGNPIEEILRASRRLPADLIVLGAKGHSDLSIMLLGSVSQGVVLQATLPVLIARPGRERLSRILIGYDDSPEARKAVGFVERLGMPRDVNVMLAYVGTPMPRAARGSRRVALAEATSAHERRFLAAESLLAPVAQRFSGRGYDASTQVLEGSAAPELDAHARKTDAGLIVVGSRKPAPSRHYLLGSVAEKLVRHAQASVLVVR
jgi:nucleotide-binding universal stress UspA family protein